jgi:hypothetical protein
MKISNRGVVDPATWAVIGLIVVSGWAYQKVTAPSRNKKVADQIAVATDQANKQAQEAKRLADETKVAAAVAAAAHAKEIADRDQMDKNASDFNGQGKALLEADPNPSPYTLIAIGMCDSVDASLGIKSTPEQRIAWAKRVVPLLQHNAEIEKQLAEARANAEALAVGKDAEHAHALAADAHVASLTSELAAQTTTIVNTTGHAEQLAAQNKNWADGAVTLAQRFKAALIGIGVLLVIIFIVSWRLRGASATLHDAVAAGEYAKHLAIKGSADAEQLLENWWGGDKTAQAAIEKIKANLRL